ncbi:MAG: DUF1987 domain-containing protein [Bacteroidales bacterium]|nr:DUF1987 domain-containing protein [Bacteroidales bacterium]
MYFYIQGTKTTPYAYMNNGHMRIVGKAVPVEEQPFFGHISKQLNRYIQKPANKTSVDISLSHVNASSKKAMVEFLKQLETINNLGFEVEVNWWYETEDDDVRELGEIFKSMFNIQIKLLTKATN